MPPNLETKRFDIAARRLFCKWHRWKSIGFYPYTQVMRYWSLELKLKANLKLEFGNQKLQHGHQAAILKVTLLKTIGQLPIATNDMYMKFETLIPKQTRVTLRKPYRRQSPENGQSNMAKKRPFWKRRRWKSTGINPNTLVRLKFGVDIQSQAKARVRKQQQKKTLWSPGGHFESEIARNQKESACGHSQHAYENWNWNSKANFA